MIAHAHDVLKCPPAAPALGKPPPDRRRKRRWLLWTGLALAGLVLLGGAGFAALVGYYHSLIRNHTQTQPLILAQVEVSPSAQDTLKSRFALFHKSVLDGTAQEPLRLSALDLNVLAAGLGQLKDLLRLQIENDQLQALFTVPLEKPGKPELKGRFLNGVATLDLRLEDDGFLTMHVAEILANDKPIPRWLLSKISAKNLLGMFDKEIDVMDFFRGLDRVEVKDGFVVLVPWQGI